MFTLTSNIVSHRKHPKPFWKKVEKTGEAAEWVIRCFLGLLFAFIFASVGYALGSYVWVGLGLLIVLFTAPIGFLVGFFWLEIKLLLQFIFGAFWN